MARWMLYLLLMAPLLMAAWPDHYPSRRAAIEALRYDLISPSIAVDDTLAGAKYEASCQQGFPLSCQWENWRSEQGGGDLDAAASALGHRCRGEPLACVVLGWSESRVNGKLSSSASNPEGAYRRFYRGCKRDLYAPACTSLGELYISGIGVERDLEEGAALVEEGCDAKDWWGCYRLGQLHERGLGVEEKPDRAAHLFERACNKGIVQGCAALAQSYLNGVGVERDVSRSAELLGQSCSEKHVPSCYTLGGLYERGEGVSRSPVVAVGLYQTACMSGDLRACYQMGRIYETGAGATPDPDNALEKYQFACGQGYAEACTRMGELHLDGKLFVEDPEEGRMFLLEGCEGGDVRGCVGLGKLIEVGSDLEGPDPEQAADIYQEACSGGSGEGCAALGSLYERGVGVELDPDSALQLYRRACSSGDGESCGRLAEKYRTGEGVEEDASETLRLLALGCDGEHGESCGRLGAIYQNGEMGVEKSESRSLDLYERACLFDDAVGCYLIGYAYANGAGRDEDSRLALNRYEFACNNGVAEACEAADGMAFRARFEGVVADAFPEMTCQVWGFDEQIPDRNKLLAESDGESLRIRYGQHEGTNLSIRHLRNEYDEGREKEGRSYWGLTPAQEGLDMDIEIYETWDGSSSFPGPTAYLRQNDDRRALVQYSRENGMISTPRKSRCELVDDYLEFSSEYCSPIQALVIASLLSDCS